MREVYYDYGPVPFRFFHYWFEVDGFDKFIKDSWKDAPIIESNALVRMMKKLNYLKEKIHMWNKLNKEKSHKSKRSLLAELVDCDAIIDKGEGENNVVNRRTEVVNLLQEVEKKNSLEAAQKAKIKWAIEGGENSKYYHGVINKKRNQLSIRVILVEGTWIDSPSLVKISKEEIKKAAWDCGIDKSPGLNGFMFGFYRRYWKLIENDVVDAVTCFFHQVQWCKKKKKQSLVFKVDFEKAYDSVRWDHLEDIMRKFGFEEKWCIWIQSCLRSSRGSVIMNGMDVGLFKGIELAPSLNLSHMFYADDAIFMGQWSESNIDTIVKVLGCFNRASGLRINMTKSKLLGISVKENKVKQATAKIGCYTLKTPFSYLGSKVGGCMSRIQSWNETIERMSCRLSKWKLKTLSIEGRLTLLKSVLGSMPIYHMSLFKVPTKVFHRIESMRSHFFNGAELYSKKSVWMKWKHALASKDKGGLGVSSLFALNRALIFKWVWRFITQGSSLWVRVIKVLHGYDDKIGQKVKSCYPSGGVETQQSEHMKEKVEGCILCSGQFSQIEEVPHVLWAHHTMIKSSNGDTPFSLMYGMEAVIPAEIGMPTLRTKEIDMVQNDEALEINLDLLEERREQAAIHEVRSKAKMEKYYNSKVRNTSFKPGDLMYQNNDVSHAKDSRKLSPKWEGSYEVTEALGKGAYKLRDRNGKAFILDSLP
nr:RNA-directed DNA polymerase, eukaryota, reverse transcriptase zinc-binding domain protein [Tanacetum cinerariifolium]